MVRDLTGEISAVKQAVAHSEAEHAVAVQRLQAELAAAAAGKRRLAARVHELQQARQQSEAAHEAAMQAVAAELVSARAGLYASDQQLQEETAARQGLEARLLTEVAEKKALGRQLASIRRSFGLVQAQAVAAGPVQVVLSADEQQVVSRRIQAYLRQHGHLTEDNGGAVISEHVPEQVSWQIHAWPAGLTWQAAETSRQYACQRHQLMWLVFALRHWAPQQG